MVSFFWLSHYFRFPLSPLEIIKSLKSLKKYQSRCLACLISSLNMEEKGVKTLIMEKKKVEERRNIVTGKSRRRRFGFDLRTALALLGRGALSKARLSCDCFSGSQGQRFAPSAQRQTSHSERAFHPSGTRKQAKYGFDVCRMKVDLKPWMLF